MGYIDIIGYASKENEDFVLRKNIGGEIVGSNVKYDLAIISSTNKYFEFRKLLIDKGLSPEQIIDGRAFETQGFDFPRLLKEQRVYGASSNFFISDYTYTIYPRTHTVNDKIVTLGAKSYISRGIIEGHGNIDIGSYTAVSWDVVFELGLNEDHNYLNVGSYGISHLDVPAPKEFFPSSWEKECQIKIGSDVWIGRGARLKSFDSQNPLVIGNGAVVSADSVVVKSVPPYAIVGGNPARIIKYRFSEDIIQSLEELKWWEWDIDKFYEKFVYFNSPEKFIEMCR